MSWDLFCMIFLLMIAVWLLAGTLIESYFRSKYKVRGNDGRPR